MATKLALDRFEVGAQLDGGAEGTTWSAVDRESDRAVVLKCVSPDDDASRLRLLTEFERLAALRAPELPTVLAVGVVDVGQAIAAGSVAMALELVDGEKPDTWGANEVARLLADGSRALEALHQAGLVHHDVKPAHLLRDANGRYRLIDLGLARPIGPPDGVLRGTLAYCAPEALIGAHDASVDLWALGVTAYELLAGRPPYDASSIHALLGAQSRPRRALEGPAALVGVIDALLSIDPQHRPSRAGLVAEELARAGLVTRGHTRTAAGDPGFVASATGRARTLDALDTALRAERLVQLVGPGGIGRTRLVEELHRRRLLAALRAGEAAARWARTIATALASAGPALLHVHDLDTRHARELLSLRPRLQIVIEREYALPDVPSLEVPPLDDDEVAQLAERMAGANDEGLLLARMSHGRPGLAIALLREALATGPVTAASLRAVEVDGLDTLFAAKLRALPEDAQRLATALALLEAPARPDQLGSFATTRAMAALETSHLVEWHEGALSLVGRAATLEPARTREVGMVLRERAPDAFTRAWLGHRLGEPDAVVAEAALREAGGRPVSQQLALARETSDPERFTGEVLFAAGRYDDALAHLVGGVARVRALRALGRREDARRAADALDDREAAVVLTARLALDAGDIAEAKALVAAHDAPHPSSWVEAERRELRGLTALMTGELATARAELVALHASASEPRRVARAEALLGMVAQGEGALDEAAARYEAALGLADRAGDAHGAAVYAGNLGGVLRELGEYTRALVALDRAVDVLGRLGRDTERGLARFNLGNLERALGDLTSARRAVDEAREAGGAAARWAELLAADLDRQEGRTDDALRRYEAITGDDDAAQLATANRAETLAEVGRLDDARAALRTLTSATHHAQLARARIELLVEPDAPLSTELAAGLEHELERAALAHARDRALRAALLLLRNDLRRGADKDATARLESARTFYEEIRMRTPELRRAALATDPDVRRLVALLEVQPVAEDPRLRRLLEINKQLNSELDLDRLLGFILDSVIELSRAERGFVLLQSKAGLEARVDRNVDAAARDGIVSFSRSIAERAIADGQPIVTIDAADDRRFETALSIVDLKLRSVLAVPLLVKGKVVGCVYVDHRARTALFRPEDVALVSDLAEQAAIAIENARLLAHNRAQGEQVRALNAQLEEKLASQTVELEGMHREVRESRRSLGVRHDYSGLIGQTPRMVELFRLLDRVTETALPVVIYGESGTGKELVARAIHHNGPRRKAAFVSESCAAIPETLLEAALFGHVRGAFTGAQGERRGLFEIADGGTLFLDEVGEMSTGMQVRLLRVLQEGEFRRVGGEKLVKVDVRVLVASNRDLGRLVEEGKFREDLFYRLNVVRIALPPLRERTADIALLVEHFLSQRPKKAGITRRALERLMRYRWPGNVRQLENELARAASLSEGTIDVADLSPQVSAGVEEADTASPEPLDLHGRVERLERGLLDEALRRAAGNQSEAARLLGLSRFGLQKKLQRYGLKP